MDSELMSRDGAWGVLVSLHYTVIGVRRVAIFIP